MELTKNKFAIRRYSKLLRFANWLQLLPNRLVPPPFRLMQIGSAFWQSRALYVCARLGLADELGDAEKSTATLAQALQLDEDHLYRLMRMLASIGIFAETAPRTFKNTALSDSLREGHPKSVRAMILMHNSPEMTRPWTEFLEPSIRYGGIPFDKANGLDLFEYMNQYPAFDTLFSQAMDAVENITGSQFLADFNWSQFGRVIDVGGSKGSKALAILKANLGLKATVFDRHQVIQDARARWSGVYDASVLDRVEFVGGDMFVSIPDAESNSDVYLFVAVFHSFDDHDCKKILANLRNAMGDKSPYAVIVDTVGSEINMDAMTASMDMQMLMGTKGRERTASEWDSVINSGGFVIERILASRSMAKYIVIRKMNDNTGYSC